MGYVQRGVAVDTWWLSSCCFELRQGVDQREGLAGTGSGFLAWQNEGAVTVRSVKMKPTAPCIPRRSPIQVLTEPYVA